MQGNEEQQHNGEIVRLHSPDNGCSCNQHACYRPGNMFDSLCMQVSLCTDQNAHWSMHLL